MQVETFSTTDASTALATTGDFLRSDPVRHNVICTLLASRSASSTPIRYWWATVDGEVRGAMFQSPATFPALVSRLDEEVVRPLAVEVASESGIPAVDGLAEDTSRFAGEYATVTRRPARPVEGQRIYEVERVRAPTGVAGVRRLAAAGDRDLIASWLGGFERETGLPVSDAAAAAARAELFVASGRLHIWEVDGAARTSTYAQPPETGVVRVGYVYSPPDDRGNGYASALVAHVSREVLEGGGRCILYTQLSNPVSNAIYQRIGYRPLAEIVRYVFDPRPA